MSQFEVMACSGLFAQYATAALHVQGVSSLNTPGMITFTLKQPFGVVAGIIPWNVSLIMFAMKVAPAIAVRPGPGAALVSFSLDSMEGRSVLSSAEAGRAGLLTAGKGKVC